MKNRENTKNPGKNKCCIIKNYEYLRNRFESLGFSERCKLISGAVPGTFIFKTNGIIQNLERLKRFYYEHGVQCSVFYGEEAFFIPVHQALCNEDLDYFYEIAKTYIQTSKSI